ncbi:MAG: hypothetical protein JRI72_13625 [Deltaproteobacteria bacterium]|nr:hypothetical protein [Deltaproteobacteria bacterium]
MKDAHCAEEEGKLTNFTHSMDTAVHAYQHGETIVQARLNNFFFADSILLLSWAAVFAGSPNNCKSFVLAWLGALSFILGVVWWILGIRHRKFLYLHTDIIRGIEQRVPKGQRVHDRISQLQEGKRLEVEIGNMSKHVRLSAIERFIRSRNLGILVPFVMAMWSLGLFIVSLCI